jgi:hypothetical protein
MSMEKRNVVEGRRTPEHELDRADSNWDKEAAEAFQKPAQPAVIPVESVKPVQQA